MESANIPAPPVFAARLSQLLKTLDTAHTAVQDAISARSELIKNLELLLDTNKSALAGEQSQLNDLAAKRQKTDDKKREVENKILSGLDNSNGSNSNKTGNEDQSEITRQYDRPVVEALTPPPMDEFEDLPQQGATPPGGEYPQYAGPDLFSTLSALNGGGRKREVEVEMGGMEELDSDVADMLRSEAQPKPATQHNKRARLEMSAGMEEDDEYHP